MRDDQRCSKKYNKFWDEYKLSLLDDEMRKNQRKRMSPFIFSEELLKIVSN